MAIYTPLEAPVVREIAQAFALGELREFSGVPQGSINTNYRLETASGRYFLRHTTVRSAADLEFEAALVEYLSGAGYPAPRLIRTARGAPFLEAQGGRVSIFHFLAGEELTRAGLTPDHTEALGRAIGRLHRLTLSFSQDRENPYSPAVVGQWLNELSAHPDPELEGIAASLLGWLARQSEQPLVPRGAIHADLFIDNVKWVGDRVSAVFDFEMACRDAYVLDLAIALNAWCFDRGYDWRFARALVAGYQLERPLEPREKQAFLGAARFGAIRYTASRIRDFHLSRLPPERLERKDFRTYLARARALAAIDPQEWLERLGL